MERLAVRPRPEKDELFSSWLVRVSAANGAKVHTFTKSACPRDTFWTRDVDRTISSEALATFAGLAGIDEEQLFATTLRSYEGILFERHNMYGNTLLILPLGIYHRIRSEHGLQYCPVCLDEHGYFRKSWRLAVITICREHLVRLRDGCWHCRAPVLLHRSEQGMRGLFDATMRYKCFECGSDLRRGRFQRTSWNSHIAAFQERIEAALHDGVISLGAAPLYAHLFFAGVRVIMQKLAAGRWADTFRQAACRHAGLDDFELRWDVKIHAVEHLSVHERFRLMGLVAHVISDWPTTFLAIVRRAGLTASALFDYETDAPFWYVDVVRGELGFARYVPNDAEILAVIRFLRRRGIAATATSIGRLLGNLEWCRKRMLSRDVRRAMSTRT